MPPVLASRSTSVGRRFGNAVFVTVEQVAAAAAAAKQQEAPRLRLFDVRYNLANPTGYGLSEHAARRPAGSLFVDVERHLCGHAAAAAAGEQQQQQAQQQQLGRHPLPTAADFAATCQTAWGLGTTKSDADHFINVCFDDKGGAMAAARFWWMLNSLGVEAYILDGGFQAYAARGLPTESGDKDQVAAAKASSSPTEDWPYRTSWQPGAVAPSVDDLDTRTLVDARAGHRFASTVRPFAVDKLPGHIPGSQNLPFGGSLTGGDAPRLKPVEELRARYTPLLAAADGTTRFGSMAERTFSCGSGVTASFNIAVAAHVGMGIPALYCGSWSQYEAVRRDAIREAILKSHGALVTRVVKANPASATDGPRPHDAPPLPYTVQALDGETVREWPNGEVPPSVAAAAGTVLSALRPDEVVDVVTADGTHFRLATTAASTATAP